MQISQTRQPQVGTASTSGKKASRSPEYSDRENNSNQSDSQFPASEDSQGGVQGNAIFEQLVKDSVAIRQAVLTNLPYPMAAQLPMAADPNAKAVQTESSNWNPEDLAGLSVADKQVVFKNMAQSLNGSQLAQLSQAFGDSGLGSNADVSAIGQAIADNATPATKASFIEAMADKGLITDGEQLEIGFFSIETRETSVYTDAALTVLGYMAGETSSFDQAVSALDDGQLTTLVQSGLGITTIEPKLGFSSNTEYRADKLVQLQSVAGSTGSVETRA